MRIPSDTREVHDSSEHAVPFGQQNTEQAGPGDSVPEPAQGADRSISVRTVRRASLAAIGVVVVLAVISVLGWGLHSVSSENSAQAQLAKDRERAELIALDYAADAAEMSFEDPGPWRERLTKGTTPELANRLTQASTSMEQLIIPLQWSSTAQPIAAKVQSSTDGLYEVVSFVSVVTKNAQSPDGIESTATYKMTIDSNQDWVITEISGIGSALDGSGDK